MRFSLVILVVLCFFNVFGQVDSSGQIEQKYTTEEFRQLIDQVAFDRSKGDKLLEIARDHIKRKNLLVGQEIARTVSSYYPDYVDARLIVARVDAWNGEYAASRKELDTVWTYTDSNSEAVVLKLDLEFWDGQLDTALSYANRYSEKWPKHGGILYRKARIQIASGLGQVAVKTLQEFLKVEPGNEDAIKMIKDLKRQYYWHIFAPYYQYNVNLSPAFRDFPYRHDMIFEYRRNRDYDPFALRATYSNRFAPAINGLVFNSVQLDGELYKNFTDRKYMYIGAGIGFGKNFPLFRHGLEYFSMFGESTWEYSIGYRDILALSDGQSTFDHTFIGTGSIGKYLGNYWLQLKGYYIPRSTLNQSIIDLTLRRYFEDEFNYAFLRTGWGQVQDMQYLWYFREYIPQTGFKIGGGIRKKVFQRVLVIAEYQREIWYPNGNPEYANHTFIAGLWWHFNTGIR